MAKKVMFVMEPKTRKILLFTALIQIPLVWLPYYTQVATCALIFIALLQMKVA